MAASKPWPIRKGVRLVYGRFNRPSHAVTYPRMSDEQKLAQDQCVENLKLHIQLQQYRKASAK